MTVESDGAPEGALCLTTRPTSPWTGHIAAVDDGSNSRLGVESVMNDAKGQQGQEAENNEHAAHPS